MIRLAFAFLLSLCVSAQAQLNGGGTGFPGPGMTTWTPASLGSALVAWYKADNDSLNVFSDTACTTPAVNSDPVRCWKDRSGNGYNCIQSNATREASYNTTGLNSKPTVSFTSANFTGCITASGVAMGTGNAASGFFIGTLTNIGTASGNFASSVAYCKTTSTSVCNTTGEFLAAFRNGAATQAVASQKGTVSTGSTAITYATVTRMGGIADGTNITTYINNVAGTPVAVTNASVSGGCIVIGNGVASSSCTWNSGGQTGWGGVISEIIITNTALSASDRASLDAYLSGRW